MEAIRDLAPAQRPEARQRRALRRSLLDWYARERRDLPWRRRSSAYAVWVSEAMLQQTRVETVVPYYERFLRLFPDIAALAAASEEEVLAAWSGLGYYRRARSLQAAARVILERHGGRFPRDLEEALALPGVGPYTAGAVLSIAYGLALPLVDGNVARVFCRLFGLDAPPGDARLQAELWERARELVPTRGGAGRGPGEWNQALMELGALVCSPREPSCDRCPLRRRCRARAQGRVAELPRRAERAPAVDVQLELFVVLDCGRILLARRPQEGRMAGMWELPTRELGSDHLWPDSAQTACLRGGEPLGELRHGITRYRIRATLLSARVEPKARISAPLAWHPLGALAGLPLTGLTVKALGRPYLRSLLKAGDTKTPG